MKYTSYIISATLILAIATACSENPSSPEPEPPKPTGSIEVQMVTTGGDDDPYGYTISIQGGESKEIEPNESFTFNGVPEGSHTLQLSGVASHCEAAGPTSQTVTVTENEAAVAEFEVQCKAILRDKIVFLKHIADQGYNIYSMDTDGSNIRQISDLTVNSLAGPSISPDGLKIAFSMQDIIGNAIQIWVMNADGTGVENMTNLPSAVNYSPVWSPDGSKIAFTSTRDDPRRDIYVMNSDGSNMMNITNDNTTTVTSVSWSPDGQRLIFDTTEIFSEPPHHYKLNIINADGSDRQVFLDEGTGVILSRVRWASNGHIAFERFIQFTQGETRQVFVTDEEQSFELNVMAEAGYPDASSYHATWAPDASKLAYYTTSSNAFNIYSSEPDGNGFTRLTNATGGDHHGFPEWSPYSRNE